MMSTIRRLRIARPLLALLMSLAAGLLFVSPASAAPWTQPRYLYRYIVWGAQRLISSRSDEYRRYGSHTIDNAPDAFHFAPSNHDEMPDTVQYEDGEGAKRVALSELLRSTGTHAFIVVRDNQVLYENPGIHRVWLRGKRIDGRRSNRDGWANALHHVARCDFHTPPHGVRRADRAFG